MLQLAAPPKFRPDIQTRANSPAQHNTNPTTMSKARSATDVVVKLIVGAGQASPSPPVGPALGSKGVKSMDFCKVLLPSPLPPFPSTTLSSNPSPTTPFTDPKHPGIQRPHRTHGPRDPHPRARHRPTRPILPLRAPHSHNLIPVIESRERGDEKGEAEGSK